MVDASGSATAIAPIGGGRGVLRRSLQRHGIARVTLAVTVISIVLSLAIVVAAHMMIGAPLDRLALVLAVVCPLVIAPVMSLNNFRLLVALDIAQAQLQRLTHTDELTGAWNRRCMMDRLHEALARHAAGGPGFAFAIIDADDFKGINDRLGHLAGDEVLRRLAAACMAEVRRTDTFARFGGEEFAVLLPDATADDAKVWLERLCARVAALRIALPEAQGDVVGVTVSIGVAAVLAPAIAGPETPSSVLRRADLALYRAKRAGKNRVSIALGAEA